MAQQLSSQSRRSAIASCLCALAIAAGTSRVAEAQPSFGDTVRFLEQSTFGPNWQLIDYVQQVGFRAFLDEQFATERRDFPPQEFFPTGRPVSCTGDCARDNYSMYPMQQHFFLNALYNPDQLRQRVAFALGQILVVSPAGLPATLPSWIRPYQQLLYENAFGNYAQLLYDVTLTPTMGRYLDMVNNVRFNPATGIKPNENYAREILQLFSIGLFELNQDGTLQLDTEGNPILTYTQDTIEEFSRVFTGWIFDVALPGPPEHGGGTVPNYRDPMIVRQPEASFHDTEEKELLNGVVLPAGQTALQDLNDAINNIMAHQSVAPFISKQLIQKLVTSNPSPQYVGRVAAVFTDNVGSPTQLQAVVEAILLDSEARGDVPQTDGHLKEPVLFLTNLLRAFDVMGLVRGFPSDGVLAGLTAQLDQNVFVAPTVFNFYEPFFEVPGEDGVLGPEFQIYSSLTALRRVNIVHTFVMTIGLAPGPDRPYGTAIDLSPYLDFASDPAGLVDAFNRLMLHGTMSPAMADLITTAVSIVPETQPLQRVRTAVYLVATSSQYQVER